MSKCSGRTPTVTVRSPLSAAAESASRLTGTTLLPNFTPPSVIGTSTRFMAGEPMKPATKRLAGRSYMLRGRVDLLEQTVLEYGDTVAHGHGLDLVVGDVHGGDAQAALEAGDLRTGPDAELGVEVGQRLVHEEDLRLTHDGAAHGDTLALTAGERLRLAAQVLGEVEDLGGVLDLLADLGLVDAGDLQREAHVVGDGHVRVERVVLEHHGDVPVLRRQVRDVAVTDADGAGVDVLEPREHAERGGLAAAGGADEDEELAVLDLDVELVDGGLVASPGRCGSPCRTKQWPW